VAGRSFFGGGYAGQSLVVIPDEALVVVSLRRRSLHRSSASQRSTRVAYDDGRGGDR
jgi:hypothetical protein